MITPELPNERWLPVWVDCRLQYPVIEWCDLGACRFREPFFDRAVEASMLHPFHQLFRRRTSIDVLEAPELAECPPPSGLVFHMGRCGSTLIAQLLASVPGTVVVSEAQPIDAVLRAQLPGLEDALRIAWLRGMVSALTRAAQPAARRIIKFHAWNTRAISLVLRAFPGVPWIFVAREPVEVIVSLLARPATAMVQGFVEPGLGSLFPGDWPPMGPAESTARLVGEICRSAAAALESDGGLVVDHADLPDVVWDSLLERFGFSASESDVQRMGTLARFDVKQPDRPYRHDSAAKQRQAGDDVRMLAAHHVPHYGRLAAIRSELLCSHEENYQLH